MQQALPADMKFFWNNNWRLVELSPCSRRDALCPEPTKSVFWHTTIKSVLWHTITKVSSNIQLSKVSFDRHFTSPKTILRNIFKESDLFFDSVAVGSKHVRNAGKMFSPKRLYSLLCFLVSFLIKPYNDFTLSLLPPQKKRINITYIVIVLIPPFSVKYHHLQRGRSHFRLKNSNCHTVHTVVIIQTLCITKLSFLCIPFGFYN
jgi:hypothetical protein